MTPTSIDLPIPFVLGRIAFNNKYPLDDNPFDFHSDSPKCLIEAVDNFAAQCYTFDKAEKFLSYLKEQHPYYQWLMGYRYQKIKVELARKYDELIDQQFCKGKSNGQNNR